MKVKALNNFYSNKLTIRMGQEAECDDALAKDLIKAGIVVSAEPLKKKKVAKNENQGSNFK